MFPHMKLRGMNFRYTTDGAWLYADDAGLPLYGDGLRVAILDTGVDVFHPGFFYDDGGVYDWIDFNSNSTFDPGTDCVDLNGNLSCDSGETLDYSDGEILGVGGLTQQNGVFEAHLYQEGLGSVWAVGVVDHRITIEVG